jgi:hypothetical protein
MTDFDATVWVLVLRRHGRKSYLETPADIIGGRFYLTAEEAVAAVKDTGYSTNDVHVFEVSMTRRFVLHLPFGMTIGVAPTDSRLSDFHRPSLYCFPMAFRGLREDIADLFDAHGVGLHDLVEAQWMQHRGNKSARARQRYQEIKADPVRYAALLAWFREHNRSRYQSRPDVRAKASAYAKARWAAIRSDPVKHAARKANEAARARAKRASVRSEK